jgi:peptidoglycan/LPS O-acetylase OafA/YrhL
MLNVKVRQDLGSDLNYPVKNEKLLKNNDRFEWLNGLRGLAALVVALYHYVHISLENVLPHVGLAELLKSPDYNHLYQTILSQLPHTAYAPWVTAVYGGVDMGKLGVIVFFAISGYIIPSSLFNRPNPIRAFFISRFFRLYPMYWVSLACLILAGCTNTAVNLPILLANITMFHKFVLLPDINGVAWTLQIEWVFYLICVASFALGRLKTLNHMISLTVLSGAMAMAAAFIRFKTGKELPVAVPLGLTLMFFGGAWRTIQHRDSVVAPAVRLALILGVAACLVVVCQLAYTGAEAFSHSKTYVVALLVFVLGSTWLKPTWRPWVVLGDISYSFYLLHHLIGFNLIGGCIGLMPGVFAGQFHWVAVPMALSVLITAGLSLLTYRWVEQPMVAIGRRLIKRL